jgi:CHAT domain-containing protein
VQEYINAGAACGTIFLNIAEQTVARALIAQGKWKEAAKHFDSIKESLQKSPEAFDARFQGDIDWAYSFILIGRLDEAKQILNLGYEKSNKQFGKNHYNSAEFISLSACISAIQGDQNDALKKFRESVPVLTNKFDYNYRGTNTGASWNRRLDFILENYIGLLADIYKIEEQADTELIDDAFKLANMSRGSSVQRAIAAGCARFAMNNSELSDLVRKDQDSKKQLAVLKTMLVNNLSETPFNQDKVLIESLGDQINKLNIAKIAFETEIEDRFPKYAQLINPDQPSIKQVQDTLAPKEVLISIFIGRNRSFVWAIPKRGDAAFESVPVGNLEVREMVTRLRYSLEPNAKTLNDIPEFDLNTAHRIFSLFIKSVSKVWKGANNLIIVPDGALSYLPFSLLPVNKERAEKSEKIFFDNYRSVDWLVRHCSVSTLPSVSSLIFLRALPDIYTDQLPFVGFGDPVFSVKKTPGSPEHQNVSSDKLSAGREYEIRGISIDRADTETLSTADISALPRLPETADEIFNMASALGADLNKHVFIRELADEQTVKTMKLDNYRVIAFASHGLAPGDLNGLIQPGIALSSPEVTKNMGDGILTVDEILNLRLKADWVVLSACNTGAGKEKGSEALSGLGRAFFYAGAKALLVSNWPVETTSTKALTSDLFQRQAQNQNLSRAEALRRAMVFLIDEAVFRDPGSGKPIFSYAHPIFWSSFTLVGDGAGTRLFNAD